MRGRLTRAGLRHPVVIANLDSPELVRRLGVSAATADRILDAVRGAARRG